MIPHNVYKAIANNVPILCVDAVIVNNGKYLLVKRRNEPLKGHWWVPGGRVEKGESLVDALRRKVKDEVGLDLEVVTRVGYYEEEFDRNELELPSVHTVSVVFIASPTSEEIQLDDQSSSYKWSPHLPVDFRRQALNL